MIKRNKIPHYPKIAFAGCGKIAHVHINFLSKLGAKVASVCDSSDTRASLFSQQYKIPHYYTDMSTMLSEENLEVLHILTPPHTHFDLIIKSLESGCHVVVEKPLCLKKSEAERIYKIAQEKNLKLCVDHTRVYNPLLLKARKIIQNGQYGKVVRMEYDYDDPFLDMKGNAIPWLKEMQGGIFEDLLPHPLSVFLSIDPQLDIKNVIFKANKAKITEELFVRLSSVNTDAFVKLSLKIKPLKNILNIYCQNGSIKIDLRNQYAVFLKHYNIPNILSRVVNTISEILQMSFGFLKSVIGILLGKIHPYSGLDEILRIFYTDLAIPKHDTANTLDALKIVDLTERIVDSISDKNTSERLDEQKYRNRLLKPAECLVTGGTGFIGKALVRRLLADGMSVRVLCRKNSDLDAIPENAGITFGDVRDSESLKKALHGVNLVYHCAAAMSGDWADFYETTVSGTANLLEAIRESQVKKLIYLSSLSVLNYNKIANGSVVNEKSYTEDKPEARGFYTQSKLDAENIIRNFADEIKKVTTIILRPGLVYGRESNKVLNNAGVLLDKYLFVFGMGKRYLGLNYIENLSDALLLASKSDLASGVIYHVVDSEQPTVSEFIRKHNALTGNTVTPIFMPIILWKTAFSLVDILLLVKNGKKGDFSYKLASNSKKLSYSCDSIQKEMQWNPPYDFNNAMEDLLK